MDFDHETLVQMFKEYSGNTDPNKIEIVDKVKANMSQSISGGDDDNESPPSSQSTRSTNSEVEVYYPKITRDMIGLYEYVGVITKLAKYLYDLPDLSKYLNDLEVNSLINESELAFQLLDSGKMDAIIDRGYEKVTFSVLKVRPQWKETILHYFAERRSNVENEMLKPLGLLDEKSK